MVDNLSNLSGCPLLVLVLVGSTVFCGSAHSPHVYFFWFETPVVGSKVLSTCRSLSYARFVFVVTRGSGDSAGGFAIPLGKKICGGSEHDACGAHLIGRARFDIRNV